MQKSPWLHCRTIRRILVFGVRVTSTLRMLLTQEQQTLFAAVAASWCYFGEDEEKDCFIALEEQRDFIQDFNGWWWLWCFFASGFYWITPNFMGRFPWEMTHARYTDEHNKCATWLARRGSLLKTYHDLQRGIPDKFESSTYVEHVLAFCTHGPLLVLIEWSNDIYIICIYID